MNGKTLADLGVSIKEIYLNRIVDRTTGEVIQEFKPPCLWWREGDSVSNPYEEVKLTKIKCHQGCLCYACENKRMARVEHYSVDVCYSYHPLYPNNNCATISSTHTNYQILWCFSIIQVISNQDKFCPGEQRSKYVYLTTEEVKMLYKDPKSIWDKADRWCEDNNDKVEDDV